MALALQTASPLEEPLESQLSYTVGELSSELYNLIRLDGTGSGTERRRP